MLLALAALLGSTPPVEVQRPHDEAPALALAWTSPEPNACPSREALLERIAGQGVGDAIGDWVPIEHAAAKLAVEVVVTRAATSWAAELRLADADGRSTRRFTASSCAALADATALIIAVTLDPLAVSNALEPAAAVPRSEPEPEPTSEPLPTRALEAEPSVGIDLVITQEPEPTPRLPDGLRFGVSIHGGAGYGPFDAASGLLGGRVALLGSRWRAELGGRWALPARLERGGAAGRFDGWMVELRGCFAPQVRAVELPLCPGLELGSVRGRGVAPTSGAAERGFLWIAPSLSQGLLWAPIERLAIGLELGLVAATTRGEFVVGDQVVTSLAPVGARGLAVFEVRLGNPTRESAGKRP